MNKKLICLTLSILMLLTCILTGCSTNKKVDEDPEGEAAQDNSAKTITMWLIGEDIDVVQKEKADGTMETLAEATERTAREQEAARKAVNKAFTTITKSKFKTNVVLQFCSEEEYYEKLETAIKANQADIELEEEARKALRVYLKEHKNEGKDNATLTKEFYEANPQYKKFQKVEADEEDGAPETDEYFENDLGIQEIKYPDPKENQVDIFYVGNATNKKGDKISGYDQYIKYYNAEWLSSLSEELSTSSKKLTDYISTSLLNGVQIEGGVYAIPNNVPIGEYTYMFIDKDLFDKYYHKSSNVKNVMDLSIFLNDVGTENAGKDPAADDYIVPLASSFEECVKMNCWYWDLTYTDQSVYQMYYDETRDRNYVVKYEYTVEIEGPAGADGKPTKKEQTFQTNSVVADKLYKTNASGQFVDASGAVLNYTYVTDSEGYWLEGKKGMEYVADTAVTSVYLVDENGNAVTEANDRRVILTAEEDGIETKMDENGNVRATYTYAINNNVDFSILGTVMLDPATRTRGGINLGFNSLFLNADYRDLYATLKDYSYKGYYGTPTENQHAAVSFVKGNAKILQDYNKVMNDMNKGLKNEDGSDIEGFKWDQAAYGTEGQTYYVEDGRTYYVVVAEYPEATEDELYGNMYAVYANSAYLSRAMKVITYLNTNSELRDLLQYGVKDIHYELNDDGTVHLLSDNPEYGTYRMDIRRTGNCFIATPEESQGADAWKYAKLQNNDSLINPLLGFDFNSATADSDYSLDIKLIDHIKVLNQQALELIDECSTKEELLTLMNDNEDGFVAMYANSAGDKKLNKATNSNYDPASPMGPDVPDQTADADGSSPYTVYYQWLNTYGYLATNKVTD